MGKLHLCVSPLYGAFDVKVIEAVQTYRPNDPAQMDYVPIARGRFCLGNYDMPSRASGEGCTPCWHAPCLDRPCTHEEVHHGLRQGREALWSSILSKSIIAPYKPDGKVWPGGPEQTVVTVLFSNEGVSGVHPNHPNPLINWYPIMVILAHDREGTMLASEVFHKDQLPDPLMWDALINLYRLPPIMFQSQIPPKTILTMIESVYQAKLLVIQ